MPGPVLPPHVGNPTKDSSNSRSCQKKIALGIVITLLVMGVIAGVENKNLETVGIVSGCALGVLAVGLLIYGVRRRMDSSTSKDSDKTLAPPVAADSLAKKALRSGTPEGDTRTV